MKKLRIIIAGGGTGGHIFPAIAIGHALQYVAPDTQLLYIGAKGKMEMEKVPKEGFQIIGLDIAGFNRKNIISNFSLIIKLIKSNNQANKIIREFKPDAVIGVGGYASFPMLKAAQLNKVPTIIQEQNSYAGKSNKILAKKAKAVCVAYAGMEQFFAKEKLFLLGNPVRKNIAQTSINRIEGKLHYGLDINKKTLLIVGGSQGAQSINEGIANNLYVLLEKNIQIIWQTGINFFTRAQKATGSDSKVVVLPFITEMEYAYAAADIIISRAGALAIAEICIAAKPVIFVPYPFAAEDHQTTNALALVTAKAAQMVRDKDIQNELIDKVIALLKDEVMQQDMSKNLKLLAIPDADIKIAHKIIEIATTK